MSAPICRSDTQTLLADPEPSPVRARGALRAEFLSIGHRTQLARVYETGGLRLRYPKSPDGCEAIIINTGGGIVGGDQARMTFEAGPHSHVILSTQAAEKIYRAQTQNLSDQARIDVELTLRQGSRLEWLPQETILFHQSSLKRSLSVHMEADASLTLLESTLFGRLAMGESHVDCAFQDRWRIHRAGTLIFADDLRLQGKSADLLARKAAGSGARAIATLLHVAKDAESRCDDLRAHLQACTYHWGVSAWNGFALIRLAASEPDGLRRTLVDLMRHLRGCEAPRVWN